MQQCITPHPGAIVSGSPANSYFMLLPVAAITGWAFRTLVQKTGECSRTLFEMAVLSAFALIHNYTSRNIGA